MSNPAGFWVFLIEFSAAYLVWRHRYRLSAWIIRRMGR